MDAVALIDTPEVKKCRKLDESKFKVDGQRLLLVYTAPEFSGRRVRIHMRNLAGDIGIDVEIFMEADRPDVVRMYVMVRFHSRFQTTISENFRIGKNHPVIFSIRCKTDWNNILAYFPEDREALEPVSDEETPPLGLSDMKYWQADVIRLMRDNVRIMKPRRTKNQLNAECKINIVLTKAKCGSSTLVSVLKKAKPVSLHVIEGIVDPEDLSELQQIPTDIWNRETLIVNVGKTWNVQGLRAMYAVIDALLLRICSDIWIFSSLPCTLTQDERQRVMMYGVEEADWENGIIGSLIPIEIGTSRRA